MGKNEITPVRRNRVIDLVQAAGVDVSDWGNFKGGPEKASTNPRYCYDWAFVNPGKVVVLNIWFDAIEENDGAIFFKSDLSGSVPSYLDGTSRQTWMRRIEKFRDAIKLAAKQFLPIRVIVIDGKRRNIQLSENEASKVQNRFLDPVPWAVTNFDAKSKSCTITRGAVPISYFDQFTLNFQENGEPERRTRTGEVFIRDPEVRKKVLLRAKGKCEWCKTGGFKMLNGGIYLETHHIIPLSEGGNDNEFNVAALCPGHHREAHHGINAIKIKDDLLNLFKNEV